MALSEEPESSEDWEGGASRRTISFYHAEGAPYLDDHGKVHARPPPEELEDLRRRGLAVPPTILGEIVSAVLPIRSEKTPAAVPSRAAASRPARTPVAPEERPESESGQGPEGVQELPRPHLKKPRDLSMVEELAYLAIRRVFHGGVRIPIRWAGTADLDVIIKGKEVVIDVNRLFFDTPKLSIWRITLAYLGEPLVVYGRGVKGDVKIHPLRLARFLVRAWMEKGRYDRQSRREGRDDPTP